MAKYKSGKREIGKERRQKGRDGRHVLKFTTRLDDETRISSLTAPMENSEQTYGQKRPSSLRRVAVPIGKTSHPRLSFVRRRFRHLFSPIPSIPQRMESVISPESFAFPLSKSFRRFFFSFSFFFCLTQNAKRSNIFRSDVVLFSSSLIHHRCLNPCCFRAYLFYRLPTSNRKM